MELPNADAPAVSEMHRDAAPTPALPSHDSYKDQTSNASHFCMLCHTKTPPDKDSVSQRDHYWDCCGCPEIDPHGSCGPCAICGCGCKLALCVSNVACLCLPQCAGACADKVRKATNFEHEHQTRVHHDPYPAFFGEAKGCKGKCLWTAACCNMQNPFGNAGFAWCGKVCWTEEYDS